LSIFSYSGQVLVGLAVDAALVPEPASILTGMQDELDELRELATSGAAREQAKVNASATG
jgi:hypothetical protein